MTECFDTPRRLGLGQFSLIDQPAIEQLGGGIQRIVDPLLAGFTDRIVQLAGHQRLGLFGLYHRLLHRLQQSLQCLTLLVKRLAQRLAIILATQGRRLVGFRFRLSQTIRQFTFVSIEFPGGIAELFSRRVDDNLSIPWASALGAWLVMLFVA